VKKKPSLKSLKNKAWKLCSEYVRRRYADEGGFCGCYTCGAPIHWKLEAQAGHAIPGRTNSVLLDCSIIRPQCYGCNCCRGGMHHVFATKLIREHGMEWWEDKLIAARQAVKLTRTDYEEKIGQFKQLLSELDGDPCQLAKAA
jgi:hypothetical protein